MDYITVVHKGASGHSFRNKHHAFMLEIVADFFPSQVKSPPVKLTSSFILKKDITFIQ